MPSKLQAFDLDTEPLNVLFICSMNQWRSPTAERIYARHEQVRTRSAGTSPRARHRASQRDLEWADVVIVMERTHRDRLQSDFPQAMRDCDVRVLDLPDEYRYMDPELVAELQRAVDPVLEEFSEQ